MKIITSGGLDDLYFMALVFTAVLAAILFSVFVILFALAYCWKDEIERFNERQRQREQWEERCTIS